MAKNKQDAPRHSGRAFDIVAYIILILMALLCIAPFYNMIVNSTHTNATISSSFKLTFGDAFLKNYRSLSSIANVWRSLFNSFLIAGGCMVLSVYFGALTAYGFAKFRFRFKKAIFWLLLCTMMLPAQLGIIGYFQLMSTMGLLDSYFALYFMAIANASCVFFIRQYCQTFVPDSMIESGRIDGMGELGIFHRLVMPVLSPAMATQAIFIFVSSWNNFINPLILLFTPAKFPITLVMQQLQGLFKQDYGAIYLGITFSVFPILIIFICLSKRILGGLTAGAVKE